MRCTTKVGAVIAGSAFRMSTSRPMRMSADAVLGLAASRSNVASQERNRSFPAVDGPSIAAERPCPHDPSTSAATQ